MPDIADSISLNELKLFGFAVAKLIKLAKVVGVIYEADHACAIQSDR